MTRKSPFSEGRQAFYMYESNCPYPAGSDDAEDWLLGYDDAAEYWAKDQPMRPGRFARLMGISKSNASMRAGSA